MGGLGGRLGGGVGGGVGVGLQRGLQTGYGRGLAVKLRSGGQVWSRSGSVFSPNLIFFELDSEVGRLVYFAFRVIFYGPFIPHKVRPGHFHPCHHRLFDPEVSPPIFQVGVSYSSEKPTWIKEALRCI